MQACAHRQGVRAFGAARPARAACVRVQASSGLVPLVESMQRDQMKSGLPKISVGDSVRVGLRVQEAKGKTRTQSVDGVIIAETGTGLGRNVTFRRVFQGIGIELKLPVHAPVVDYITLVNHGRVRRSKLYYLRDRIGKSAKLKEIVGAAKSKRTAQVAAAEAAMRADDEARAAEAAARQAAAAPKPEAEAEEAPAAGSA
eukprot:355066-Chlamydomonas_euryale.AAC.10